MRRHSNPMRPAFTLFKTATLFVATMTLGLTAAASPAQAADTYKLDSQHSYALFKVMHLGLNWSYGSFQHVEGSYVLDPANLAASSFEIRIKADTIDTGVEKRDQHLKGPDFFDVKQFPWLTFESKKVEKAGDGYRVTGALTIHGVTNSVTVDVKKVGEGKDPWGNFRTGLHAEFPIKRSDYGMKWGIDNGVVGDEVYITLSVEGIRE